MNALDILSSSAMHMLYDSDAYAVVHVQPTEGDEPLAPHLPVLARHGFEIVDKRSGKEVYLDGSWADSFSSKSPPGRSTRRRRKRWKTRWKAMRSWRRTRCWFTERCQAGRSVWQSGLQ